MNDEIPVVEEIKCPDCGEYLTTYLCRFGFYKCPKCKQVWRDAKIIENAKTKI